MIEEVWKMGNDNVGLTAKVHSAHVNKQPGSRGFSPSCLPLFLGSMAGKDHFEAVRMIMRYSPDIPTWPQLPENDQESIIEQFLPGLPGLQYQSNEKFKIVTNCTSFADEVVMFYQEYRSVVQGLCSHQLSRFVIDETSAKGLYSLLLFLKRNKAQIISLKGQSVGPATFLSSLRDQDGVPLYENKDLRECAIILLALKAQYQARLLGSFVEKPIIFLDEPMLFNFGRFGSDHLSYEKLLQMYRFIFDKIEQERGITGIHVCADTEWKLVFDSGVKIISFDAYSYYESLFTCEEQLKRHIDGGKFLSFGIIPTSEHALCLETCESLVEKFMHLIKRLENIGIARQFVFQQSFITPTCGTGRTSPAQSLAVQEMTKNVSDKIRARFFETSCC